MLEEVLNAEVVSIDIETTGFNWRTDSIRQVNFGWIHGDYGPVGTTCRDPYLGRHIISKLLNNPHQVKVGWNMKFDLHFLRTQWGLVGHKGEFWDGMVVSHLLDENTDNELKSASQRSFGDSVGDWEDLLHTYWPKYRPNRAWELYGATDAILPLLWYQKYNRQMQLEFPNLWKTEMDIMWVVLEMEERGVKIDVEYLATLPKTDDYIENKKRAFSNLETLVGKHFNHNSSKQVSKLLYQKLGLKPLKFSPKGFPKADEESLTTYKSHPVVSAILECRGIDKLESNYIYGILEKVDANGYLHGRFNQIGTVSGRFSSSDPNLQNIPRGKVIRRAFLADPWLFDNDCVQIEARLFAHFTREPDLIGAFESGFDIHASTYSDLFGIPMGQVNEVQRKRAKGINFGIMYGIGIEKLARVLGISKRDAGKFMERYLRRYPSVRALQTAVRETVANRGFIRNPFERKARLPANKAYVGINRLIQGTAADVIKRQMVRFRREFPSYPLRLTVHDEIAWDLTDGDPHRVIPRVVEALEDFIGFRPTIKVDVEHSHKNWADKEVWK